MLYSRQCEYAIRALTHLAQKPDGELVRLSEIAEARELPLPFARKICRDMVREEFMRSARGPQGEYALARPPSQISLLEIRDAVDGSEDLQSCAVGVDPCTDETPCSLHHSWKPLREKLKRYLPGRRRPGEAASCPGCWGFWPSRPPPASLRCGEEEIFL